MLRLGVLDVAHQGAQWRAPHERAADGRKPAARALQASVALEQARARDAAAFVTLRMGEERPRTAVFDAHVGVQDQHEGLGCCRNQGVLVLGERPRALVGVGAEAQRPCELCTAVVRVLADECGDPVARESRETVAEQVALIVRHDRGDDPAHASVSR